MTSNTTCPICTGRGNYQDKGGYIQKCFRCHGTGQIPSEPKESPALKDGGGESPDPSIPNQIYTDLEQPKGYDPDDVWLCNGCGTMKHLNAKGYCGRCEPKNPPKEVSQDYGNSTKVDKPSITENPPQSDEVSGNGLLETPNLQVRQPHFTTKDTCTCPKYPSAVVWDCPVHRTKDTPDPSFTSSPENDTDWLDEVLDAYVEKLQHMDGWTPEIQAEAKAAINARFEAALGWQLPPDSGKLGKIVRERWYNPQSTKEDTE